MRQWVNYIGRRIALMLTSLWVLVTVTFFLIALLPSDPARAVVGNFATQADYLKVVHNLGLDQPLWVRYIKYLEDLFTGNLGNDVFTGHPVLEDISKYLPATLELIILSLVFAIIFGVTLGSVSAYYAGKALDKVSTAIVNVCRHCLTSLLA